MEETRIAFIRNLGVGYGYNAVSGRYCNYADIRCQILNRRQLEKAAQASGMTLWHTDYTSRSYSTSQVAYNEHDYVATFNLGRESSFNYIIYKEEQTYRQNILEDGLRQSFYFSTDDYEQVATAYGIASRTVTRRDDLDDAIREMLGTPGAFLLQCAVEEEDNVMPMCPPGHDVDDMMLTVQ